jgi:hypothetical protein
LLNVTGRDRPTYATPSMPSNDINLGGG